MKYCTGCDQVKPFSEFHIKRASPDGYQDWCKQCYIDYVDAHPEKVLLRNARKRAREKGIGFTITADDIHIPECCPICGVKLTHRRGKGRGQSLTSPTLDRYDNSVGYHTENIWVICSECNVRKGDRTVDELFEFAEQIVKAWNERAAWLPLAA